MAHRSPAAVVAAAAAAAGAGWGAEANQWHPQEGDAAAATPTPVSEESRSAREPQEQAARPGARGPCGREAADAAAAGSPWALAPQVPLTLRTPRCAMFKKLKQKVSEEQQQFQQALASTQVLWLLLSPSSRYASTLALGRKGGEVLP